MSDVHRITLDTSMFTAHNDRGRVVVEIEGERETVTLDLDADVARDLLDDLAAALNPEETEHA